MQINEDIYKHSIIIGQNEDGSWYASCAHLGILEQEESYILVMKRLIEILPLAIEEYI